MSQNLNTLNAKVDALRLIYKFVYFYSSVSYEELFGLYIAMAGVFVTVCLGTGVLLFTDIVCPMLKCGSESWRASIQPVLRLHSSAAAVSPECPGGRMGEISLADGVALAARQGFQVWQGVYYCKDLVEVVLRCMVSLVLGTSLSIVCVLLPLLASQDFKGSCGPLKQQKLASVFIC